MSEEGFREVNDDHGTIIVKQLETGRWVNWKRISNDNIEFMLYNPTTKDYSAALRAAHVNLVMNQMNDAILVNNKRLTDSREAIILNALFDFGLRSRQRIRDVLLETAYKNKYHPLVDYLNSLHWDGLNRLGGLLDHFTFLTSEEWSRTIITKWLIGAVAKVLEHAQLFMLVLDGPQGCGKSHFVRWLSPLDKYFMEGPIHPGLKDTDIMAISKWIWEVAELQATTRRADREALKSHITKQVVTVRAPYARYSITKPATAAYLGTINQDAGFLEDDTGNRRFVIVEVGEIDWSYVSIDCDQLWAQIVSLYKDGHEWNLSPAETSTQEKINKNYDAPHPVIEFFLEHYAYEPGLWGENFVATVDIIKELEEVGLKGNQRGNMMKLTSWLKGQGSSYDRASTKNGQLRGFYGIKHVNVSKRMTDDTIDF